MADERVISVSFYLQLLNLWQRKSGTLKFAETLIKIGNSFVPAVKGNIAKSTSC